MNFEDLYFAELRGGCKHANINNIAGSKCRMDFFIYIYTVESILWKGMFNGCFWGEWMDQRATAEMKSTHQQKLCLNRDCIGPEPVLNNLSDDYRHRYIITNMNMWEHFVNKIIFKWTYRNSSLQINERSSTTCPGSLGSSLLLHTPVPPCDHRSGSQQACCDRLHGLFESLGLQWECLFNLFSFLLCLTIKAICDSGVLSDTQRRSLRDTNEGAECLRLRTKGSTAKILQRVQQRLLYNTHSTDININCISLVWHGEIYNLFHKLMYENESISGGIHGPFLFVVHLGSWCFSLLIS